MGHKSRHSWMIQLISSSEHATVSDVHSKHISTHKGLYLSHFALPCSSTMPTKQPPPSCERQCSKIESMPAIAVQSSHYTAVAQQQALLYLGCGKVEGITLAVAQCMVEAPESILPCCLPLVQQVSIGLACSQCAEGGGLVGGLWVLPAHGGSLVPFL